MNMFMYLIKEFVSLKKELYISYIKSKKIFTFFKIDTIY